MKARLHVKASTILYRVLRPNQSVYFGIYDPATRRIRTERTEQAAAAVADEMGLQLDGERDVTHDQWLRLTGRLPVDEQEVSAEQVMRDSIATIGKPSQPAASIEQPSPVREPSNSGEFDDPLLLQRPVQRFSPFATENLPSNDNLPDAAPPP